MSSKNYILLYDGVCGLCNGAVRYILNHDKKKTIRFASLQSEFARAILERHPQLKEIDSLVLLESADTPDETFFVQSAGVVKIAEYLGGVWVIGSLFRFFPKRLSDAAYDYIARRRYSLFGRYDACPLPSPETRSRFLG
ncbi:MAG: thiol-disulfide oxidoreductase DCC family protein [Bacteroidota bacterium]